MVLVSYGITQAFSPSATSKDTAYVLYASCLPTTIVAVRMITVASREGVWDDFMGYIDL